MAGHPNTLNRSPRDIHLRVLAFAPDATMTWIEEDLAGERITLQIARTVAQVVSALVVDPPPRAAILVADFDAITAAEVLELHSIRERGWFGAIVGLGHVPGPLCTSLSIANVIAPPFQRAALREAIAHAGIGLPTTKMPKL